MEEITIELSNLRAEFHSLTGQETSLGKGAKALPSAKAARRRLLAKLKPLRAVEATQEAVSVCPRCESSEPAERGGEPSIFGLRNCKTVLADGTVKVTQRRQSHCTPCRTAGAREKRQAAKAARDAS